MKKKIFVFHEICSGCRNCEMWCSFANSKGFHVAKARIRVDKDPKGELDIPIVDCSGQCPHPYNEEGLPLCVEMCPTGTLVYTETNDASEKRTELYAKREAQPLFKLVAPWKWPYSWKEIALQDKGGD